MENTTLYIIATPIGNMEDITLRALRVLGEVDTVFCEDIRVAGKLLRHHNIEAHMVSMNARTEERKIEQALTLLADGKDIAYISDAGTPGISDPGVRLVARARATLARVVPIPGPSALTTALSIAGAPTNKFCFFGFLPQKKGRQTAFKEIAQKQETIVLYESTHRIVKFLKEAQEFFPDKRIILARELTKIYEETLQGSAQELLSILENNPQKQKGEFVVIIS